ncbi:MAG: tRNA (adenosine(37)-N6)-threonylcarbamoyltransferase complex ATPase subunit type 1 TsaE [Candidatus Levybacteria bacterium]|nr:tRNA (adenosine(37)-N6)-threonylcarbamoyltransferase complex ATPase subunit type 1 TsaE [Candidatus Levybacteria bacterium]
MLFITKSSEETRELGKELAKSIQKAPRRRLGALILALYGELGSGKTTFVQGMAKGLGIERRIISPTFVIIRSYKVDIKHFYHIDLYRIDGKESIKDLGIEEIINNPENIVAIEWAEKMISFLPKSRIDIKFFYENISKRKIEISSVGE